MSIDDRQRRRRLREVPKCFTASSSDGKENPHDTNAAAWLYGPRGPILLSDMDLISGWSVIMFLSLFYNNRRRRRACAPKYHHA